MPVSQRAAGNARPLQMHPYFLQVLPARDLEELLPRLCLCWQLAVPHSEVYLSVFFNREQRLQGYFLGSDGQGLAIPQTPVEQRTWSSEAALDVLFQQFAWSPLSASSLEMIPLEVEGQTIGGVILCLPERHIRGSENFQQFEDQARFSARILAQLIEQTRLASGLPAGSYPAQWDVLVPEERKLEALAEFAAGAGHEINNPVATITGRAQLLLKQENDPERRQALLTIARQGFRIRDMISDAMLFARPPVPSIQPTLLNPCAQEVLTSFAEDFQAQNIQLTVSVPEQLKLKADPVQLKIVLSELLRNALEASGPGGRITLGAKFFSSPDRVRIVLQDSGPLLSETVRRHLFDPFFSGRQAGRGLGFGLCKCWRIVSNHGGILEAHTPRSSEVSGEGNRMVIDWPAAE